MSGELPPGWELATLPDLAGQDGLFVDGDWVESKDQDPSGEVRLVQLADVGDGFYRDRSDRFLTKKKADELGCTFLIPGDVLISRLADPLGRACIFPGDSRKCVTVVDVAVFRTADRRLISHDWLKNWINAAQFRSRVELMASGTTRKRISRTNLGSIKFPLPPSNEQKRIVAKLDALQARHDAAKQALEAIPPLLEKFRQSVLAAAFRGDLTREWRARNPDVEPASELLARIRAERRRRWEEANPKKKYVEPEPVDVTDLPELPEGWCWSSFEEITDNHDGRRIPVKREDRAKRQGPYRYYGASGPIDSFDDYLFDGDHLLIAEDGANLLSRSTPIAFTVSGRFWVNNHAHIVQTFGSVPLDYLAHFLNGISLQSSVTGSAQPKLTQKAMNNIPVALAPLSEQNEIVPLIRDLFDFAASVSSKAAEGISRLEWLSQSLLAKAFRGELVPQDPNDEPASVLLERIRAERAAVGGASATKKRRGRSAVRGD